MSTNSMHGQGNRTEHKWPGDHGRKERLKAVGNGPGQSLGDGWGAADPRFARACGNSLTEEISAGG